MEALKILLLCVLASIAYGVCQDMITTRVCLEYFTVGHPPIFGGTQNPTLLAFSWGVFTTWWLGLGLGIPTAFFARFGSRTKFTWRELRKPIALLMAVVAVAAVGAGVVGYSIGGGFVRSYMPQIPEKQADVFAADAFAQETTYGVGFFGGLIVWAWVWWKRGRLSNQSHRASAKRKQPSRARQFQSEASAGPVLTVA